jgi:hypothetical protein
MICNEFRIVALLFFSIGKAFFFINNIVTLPKKQMQKKAAIAAPYFSMYLRKSMRRLYSLLSIAMIGMNINAQQNDAHSNMLINTEGGVANIDQTTEYEQMKQELSPCSLPLINLTVDTTQVGAQTYAPAFIEIADPKGESFCGRCKVRYRGLSALAYAKKSFSVKLVDEAGEKLDANLFGIRLDNSWILDAMAIDRIRMRNRICFDIWNSINRTPYPTSFGGRNGTEGRFVELFINGQYHGLYCLTDKIDRKLLGLKKAKVSAEGEVRVRGILYKGVSWNEYDDIYLLSYKESPTDTIVWNSWELKYPDEYPSQGTWMPLMELIDFCSERTSDDKFEIEVNDYFYVDNLIDYVVFTFAMLIGDNLYNNTFLSVVDIESRHQYLLTPWDMDASMGGSWNGSYNNKVAYIGRYDTPAPFNRLMAENLAGFQDKVKQRWQQYRKGVLSIDSVYQWLDRYSDMFIRSGAWNREYEKWNDNPVPLRLTLEEEIDYVKQWYKMNYYHLCNIFDIPVSVNAVPMVVENAPLFQGEEVIFNLQGQRISAPQKGINIIGGKKVWVR